ncbi:hypothetical protein [Xanthomonas campestris]|uniref:Uncharacterized protein n=1 Tax=Xanthomonas campestris pv. campestris (strain 8004) TaxID=314565 RepID=A0A0H2X899_XANC8|nr:hypothetical protein [Xanthomonas campestris]AAY49468.1 hypothetical protein XC_2418 [Xanthomonas campestris pv. campestris str. 8004]MBD8246554.1 hypothetical protein [Xanthomonas campestris]
MFTPIQTKRIEDVQAVLFFPLDLPQQFLTVSMHTWNYSTFQTALVISWIISQDHPDQSAEAKADLASLSKTMKTTPFNPIDLERLDSILDSLDLHRYEDLSVPVNWPPSDCNESNTTPVQFAHALSQFAEHLVEIKLNTDDKQLDSQPTARSPWIPKRGGQL